MPIDLIFDVTVEQDNQEYGKCIRAPEPVFRMVAGILLKLATEKPDASGSDALNGVLSVDHALQASFFSFALQCLGDALCAGEGGEMPQNLRTKPTDGCVLQQDQGGEFVDVFDFGACLEYWLNATGNDADTKTGVEAIKNAPLAAEKLMAEYLDKYTGTSASFDSRLVNDSMGKRAGICAALKKALRNYVDQSIKAKQTEIDTVDVGGIGIGVAMAIMALMATSLVFPPTAAAAASLYGAYVSAGVLTMGSALLGVSAAAMAVWVRNVKDTALPVFEDDIAFDEVLCAWYEALKEDSDISQTDYAQTLDLSGASGNGQALYAAIKPLIEQELSYAAFLQEWARNTTGGEAGAIFGECGCDTPDYTLATPPGGTAIIEFLGFDGEGYAVYEASSLSSGVGGPTFNLRIDQGFTNPAFQVKQTHLISNVENIRIGATSHMPAFDPDLFISGFAVDGLTDDTPPYAVHYPIKIRVHVYVAGT